MAPEESTRDVADALAAIHETGEAVRERELQTALSKLDDLDAADRAVVETLAARLVDGILASPTESLLTAAADADPETVETALTLFGERGQTGSRDEQPAEQASPGVARAQD